MGKQSRKKKERREQGGGASPRVAAPGEPPATEQADVATASGDLRLIEAHVEQFRRGVKEAEVAIKMMGRDASLLVTQIGERLGDVKVTELGNRLVAVRPQVATNLYELRSESVGRLIDEAAHKAPVAGDGAPLPKQSHQVALFDPAKVADALTRGGRPRTDLKRVAAGHVAVINFDGIAEAAVELVVGPPPAELDQPPFPLDVESGVIFVGPPEASDGPRLGTVRLDPFRTALDDHLSRGGFRRLERGHYEVRAGLSDNQTVRLHLTLRDAEASLSA